MRLSRPTPFDTFEMSAPVISQICATALMKLIFMARKALEACLMSSAELRSVIRMGALRGA
ncbi:hypothetical protein D3C72_1420600 [compost metagenome]